MSAGFRNVMYGTGYIVSFTMLRGVQIQKEVISDLKCGKQFLSKEIWESLRVMSDL